MKQLKEQLQVEKEAWEENYKKKQDTWLVAKERELKDQVRRDRDKEIELVIGRLEEDSQVAQDDMERSAENRIRYRHRAIGTSGRTIILQCGSSNTCRTIIILQCIWQ